MASKRERLETTRHQHIIKTARQAGVDRERVKTRQCYERTNVGRSDRAVGDSFAMRRGRMTPQFETDPRFHTASTHSGHTAVTKADLEHMCDARTDRIGIEPTAPGPMPAFAFHTF